MKGSAKKDAAGNGFSQAMEKAAHRLATAAAAGPPKSSAGAPRKLDTAKTSSMDVESLNNLVVQMRKAVRKAKVLTIRKLTHAIKKLRAKKGSSEQIAKNTAKADRLVEEIFVMKAANDDRVSKFALSNTLSLQDIHKQKQPSAHIRALTRLAEHKNLQEHVRRWRSEHTDWEELGAFLLAKNTGRRFRKKKLKATPITAELNKTLLKETIKKAAKEVGAPIILSDLEAGSVDGTAEDSEDGDNVLSPAPTEDQEASAVCESSGENSVDENDDSDSAESCDDTISHESCDSRALSHSVENIGHAPQRAERQREQPPASELDEACAEGASTVVVQLPRDRSAKNSRSAEKKSRTNATARSAEMVVARIDLSAADTADGCIIMPTAIEPSQVERTGATDDVRIPVVTTKKKSSFFIRSDGQDDDDNGSGDGDNDGDGVEDAGEADSLTASEDGEDRDGDALWRHQQHRPNKLRTSRSVFVASLHGRASGAKHHTGSRSLSTRGRGQAVRRDWEDSSQSWRAPRAGGNFSAQRGRSNRGRVGSSTGQRTSGDRKPQLTTSVPASLHQKKAPGKLVEKLHPSWEASRKRKDLEKLASQPFAGKKIKFDD